MNEISCEICMDLIPLVRDGIASPDSEEAVRHHLCHCESCSAFFDGVTPPPSDSGKIYRGLRHQLRLAGGMLLMFGLFIGLSLGGNQMLFYNILLMPAMGAVGYCLFRWKALCRVPLLIAALHLVMNVLGLALEPQAMPLQVLLMWSGIYASFALIGVVIAGLLHFALRKEN